MEQDMTTKFFCILYSESRNDLVINREGMNPNTIWEKMDYRGFSGYVVSQVIRKLIRNNELAQMVTFDESLVKVTLSEKGREWGDLNCGRWL